MDNVIFFLIGMILAFFVVGKPINIVIHHKNENLMPHIPEKEMPKMSDVLDKVDAEEDKAYKNMDNTIKEINEVVSSVFGGRDRQ